MGGVPKPDLVVHADTTWERTGTYSFMDRWAAWAADNGVPIVETRDEKAARQIVDPTNHVVMTPAYQIATAVRTFISRKGVARTTKVGDKSKMQRTCTSRWKIDPTRRVIAAKLRELKIKRKRDAPCVRLWLGISLDEWTRVKDSQIKYIANTYPLLDMKWARKDCIHYLQTVFAPAARGYLVAAVRDRLSTRAVELLEWYIDVLVSQGFHAEQNGIFGVDKDDSIDILHAFVPPKSSCTFCPFGSIQVWEAQRTNAVLNRWFELATISRVLVGSTDAGVMSALSELAALFIGPDPTQDWRQSIMVDAAIRDKRPGYKTFVHRRFLPLEEAVDALSIGADEDDPTCDSGFCFM